MTFDNLKSAWNTRLSAQYAIDNDPVSYQSALINLDLYVLALTTESKNIASDVASYSIGGQSVTKYQSQNVSNNSNIYLKRLERYCGKGAIIIDDFSTN